MSYILLAFSILLLSSCASNRIIGEKTQLQVNYNDQIFYLTKLERMGSINGYGSGTFSHVKNGKFYIITLEVKNNSDLNQETDLRKIYLCDSTKNCLTVGRIDYNTIVDLPAKDILKLRPNQKDGRHMFYAGPRDFVPMYLVIDAEKKVLIKFGYKKD